jgi:hypothetical protein
LRKILGYKLKNLPLEKIELPVGSNIMNVMDVYGEPTLFADVDMHETQLEFRSIHRVTTGRPVEEEIVSKRYIGSISIANYGIVYHFYTGGDPKELVKSTSPIADLSIEVSTIPRTREGEQPPLVV